MLFSNMFRLMHGNRKYIVTWLQSICRQRKYTHLLVRPRAIACGADLSFTRDVFFSLARSPRCVGRPAWNFARWSVLGPIYNAGPKFWGTHAKKISGAKNMQNLARFRMTSKFGGEYLRNGWRFSKSDFYSIYRDSSCVRWNKSSEV